MMRGSFAVGGARALVAAFAHSRVRRDEPSRDVKAEVRWTGRMKSVKVTSKFRLNIGDEGDNLKTGYGTLKTEGKLEG